MTLLKIKVKGTALDAAFETEDDALEIFTNLYQAITECDNVDFELSLKPFDPVLED